MAATLAGSVTLQGGQKNIVIIFFAPGTWTVNYKYARALDASGNFTVTGITPGTYDIGIKSDGSISSRAADQVFTEGNTTNVNFGTLRGGDLNNDDCVTITDRTLLYLNFLVEGDCIAYTGGWLMPDWPTGGGGEQSFVSVV